MKIMFEKGMTHSLKDCMGLASTREWLRDLPRHTLKTTYNFRKNYTTTSQHFCSISHFTKSYFLCTAAWISYPYPSPKYLLYLAKCFWKMDIWTSTSAEYAVTLVLQTQLGLWSLPRVPFPFAILNMLYQICYCVLLSSISCFLSFTPCLLYFA